MTLFPLPHRGTTRCSSKISAVKVPRVTPCISHVCVRRRKSHDTSVHFETKLRSGSRRESDPGIMFAARDSRAGGKKAENATVRPPPTRLHPGGRKKSRVSGGINCRKKSSAAVRKRTSPSRPRQDGNFGAVVLTAIAPPPA